MGKVKKYGKRVCVYVFAIILVLWSVLPVLWMFISSLTPSNEIIDSSILISNNLTLDRFRMILFGTPMEGVARDAATQSAVFRHAMLNSTIVAVVTTAVSIVIGASASYAFARLSFKGSKAIQFAALFFQLLPPIALLIPYYIIASKLRALDKLSTLVVVNTNFVLSYVIWVMSNFFRSIPKDLENAARLDGCTWFQAYVKIALPNALPGFVAVGALAFLMCWDEFMFALVFTQSNKYKMITVAVSEFGTKFGIDYGMTMAAGVMATIVPMLFVLFFQKYIVSGLTSGSVKE